MKTKVKFTMWVGCEDLKPVKAHEDDAGFDLKSRISITINKGKPYLVPTGLFIELSKSFEAQVRPRSGLALKHSITVLNAPGTIDCGYTGEVGVILMNLSDKPFEVKRGDRIAQMVIQKLPEVQLVKVEQLAFSERGKGGYGSSGRY